MLAALLVTAITAVGDMTGRHYDQRRGLREGEVSNLLSNASKINEEGSFHAHRGVRLLFGSNSDRQRSNSNLQRKHNCEGQLVRQLHPP